jgi:menaquinone-9 beta-reductase
VLHARLAGARFDEDSFCSVAGLCLRPQRATERTECCVGDALTMIPPVTGNGMSMAFESAELAIKPLTRFSRGELSWAGAQASIARACDQRFTSRLRWAAGVQRALFQPLVRGVLLFAAGKSECLWRAIFARTR